MVRQVAPRIYCIPVPLPNNPLKELNAYVVRGERNLLVDTGFRMDACRAALESGLAELGVSMNRTDIFLTHLHTDHSGLAPDLAAPDTRIFLSGYGRTRLPGKRNQMDWSRSDRFYRQCGMPASQLMTISFKNPMRSMVPTPYDDYILIQDGDTYQYGDYTFRAVATPGHTPGHMCLWEPDAKILFSGDHVLFDITPNITSWQDVDDSLGQYLQSLKMIARLPARVVLPGHRSVHGTLQARVRELILHHRLRCEEVLRILQTEDDQTAYEIAARMAWKIRASNWEAFPPPQKWFAVGEAVAHLDHLRAAGLVRSRADGDVIRWVRATNPPTYDKMTDLE